MHSDNNMVQLNAVTSNIRPQLHTIKLASK